MSNKKVAQNTPKMTFRDWVFFLLGILGGMVCLEYILIGLKGFKVI